MTSQSFCWSWRHAILKSGLPKEARLLLQTLGCYMNELGESCFPSIRTIASDTGMAESTVKKYIAFCEVKGWLGKRKLSITRPGADNRGWRRNEYFALIPDDYHLGKTPEARDENNYLTADQADKDEPSDGLPSEKGGPSDENGGPSESKKVGRGTATNSPVNTPENPSTSAQAREGVGEPIDEGLKKKLLTAWHEWDGKFKGSEANLLRVLEQVEPDKRQDAVCLDRVRAFRAVEAKLGGKKLETFSTYIKELKFEAQPVLDYLAREKVCADANGPNGISLKPLGKAWMAHRLWQCFYGRQAEWQPNTAFQKAQYAQNPDVFQDDVERTKWAHVRFTYPVLTNPDQLVGDLETYQQINRQSPQYEAWEAWFAEQGYPQLNLPNRDLWLWMPRADVREFEREFQVQQEDPPSRNSAAPNVPPSGDFPQTERSL